MTKDGNRPATKWRPELLPLAGIDADPWRALLLSQLVWYAAITTKADKWTHQTAKGLREAIGADGCLSESIVRRKLRQLEKAGLIESREGWQRRKEYRPDIAHEVVGAAYEAARGASHVVAARSIRNHSSDAGTTVPNGRNHSSDGRNHSSDASKEESLEVVVDGLAHAPENQTTDWRGFDTWLIEVFTEAGYTLRSGLEMSFALNLSEKCHDRTEAEAYVRHGLVGMGVDDAPVSKVVRALQKQEHLEKFRKQQKPETPTEQSMVDAADWSRRALETFE